MGDSRMGHFDRHWCGVEEGEDAYMYDDGRCEGDEAVSCLGSMGGVVSTSEAVLLMLSALLLAALSRYWLGDVPSHLAPALLLHRRLASVRQAAASAARTRARVASHGSWGIGGVWRRGVLALGGRGRRLRCGALGAIQGARVSLHEAGWGLCSRRKVWG